MVSFLLFSFPGAGIDVDDCGGHSHDAYGYHYHSQLVSMIHDNKQYTSYISGTLPHVQPRANRLLTPYQDPTNAGKVTSAA